MARQGKITNVIGVIITICTICANCVSTDTVVSPDLFSFQKQNLSNTSYLAPETRPLKFRDIAREIGLGGIVNKILVRHGINSLRLLKEKWPQVARDLRNLHDSSFNIGIFDGCVYIMRGKYLIRYNLRKDAKDDLYISALERYEDDTEVKLFDERVEVGGSALYMQVYVVTPDIENHIRLVEKFLPGDLNEVNLPAQGFSQKDVLVFDVDGTLLESKRSLADEPSTLETLLGYLEEGFRIAIISGNSRPEQRRRIWEPIRQGLIRRNSMGCAQNLVMYVNGGATKIVFDSSGNEIMDDEYNADKGIAPEDIEIIKNVLNEMLGNKFGLTKDELSKWKKWFKDREDFPNIRFELSWTKGRVGDISVVEAEDITAVTRGKKPPMVLNSPWLEIRDNAQVSIKLLPKSPRDVRDDVIKNIESELEKAGLTGRLTLRKGGFASVDINRSDINKKTALQDLINHWNVADYKDIAYFGDEFVKSGNDLPILDIDGVRVFAAVPEDNVLPDCKDRVVCIGKGPESTKELLHENLEDLRIKKSLEVLGLPADGVLEDTLWGTDGNKSQFRMAVERFMGVKDLVSDQRVPEHKHAAEERARKALRQSVLKLAGLGKKMVDITQDEFNSLMGVSQVVLGGGFASRYHGFLHKALGHPEITGDTNMRLAIWGSYKSPGTHPIIAISDRLIIWLLKDEIVEELINSGKSVELFMIGKFKELGIKPIVIDGVIQKGILVPDSMVDPDKKALFFTEDTEAVYFYHYGYGDAFAEALLALKEQGTLDKTKYKQYVFAEMAEACLPDRSNASFIAYLESLGNDSLITIGVKEADPRTQRDDIIAKKGNLFLENGRLIACSDPPDMPKYRREKLRRALDKLADWGNLSSEEKKELRKEFAVTDNGMILISGNCGIFRNDIVDYFDDFYGRDEEGRKGGFVKVEIDEYGRREEFRQVDPKLRIPFYIAPNLIETVSRTWQERGWNIGDMPVGYVDTGHTPTSIKDMGLQERFDENWQNYIEGILGRRAGLFLGARADRKAEDFMSQGGTYASPGDLELFNKRREILRRQIFYTAIMYSKNYRSLLKVFNGDKEILKKHITDAAEFLDIDPVQVILGVIGEESVNYLGLQESQKRFADAPMSPRILTLTGGTAIGTFLLDAVKEAGFMAEDGGVLLAALLPTLDDGGSTYEILTGLQRHNYGFLPPIGDQANVLLTGLAGFDRIKYVFGDSGRVRDDLLEKLEENGLEISLENIIIFLLRNTYQDVELSKSPDMLYLAVNILAAARIIDNNYIKKGILKLKGASIRNLFMIAVLHEYGLLVPDKRNGAAAVDSEEKSYLYNQALLALARIAGVKDGIVAPMSFDPATMYARYEDNVLIWKEIRNGGKIDRILLIKPEKGGIRVRFGMDQEPGNIIDSVLSNGETIDVDTGVNKIRITNISGEPLININGEGWILKETDTEAFLVNAEKENEKYILTTDGSGRGRKIDETEYHPLNIKGLEVCLRPRLIVMQTNIAETANFSRITDVGIMGRDSEHGEYKSNILNFNKEAVRLIDETKDMVIVGPGSLFTSILPHFMVPGIVNALVRAKNSGKRVVWIMNGTLDNETAGLTVSDIIKFMETISRRKLDDIFTDVIFSEYDEKKVSKKLKKYLYQRPAVEIRDPSAGAREGKKSLGPLLPTCEEIEGLKKRGIVVHQDSLLCIKETIDRITGKISYKVTQDSTKVAQILKGIYNRIIFSHEIEENWEIVLYDADKRHLCANIRYHWKGNFLGELYLDLDTAAASINTCYLRQKQTGQGISEEMITRAYIGAYYISSQLGWETQWAHAFFTLSHNEEREAEFWPPEKWDWMVRNRPEVKIIKRLGLVEGMVNGKEHLDGAYGRYNDRRLDLAEFAGNTDALWHELFYKRRIIKILGEDNWEKMEGAMRNHTDVVLDVLKSNAKRVAAGLEKWEPEYTITIDENGNVLEGPPDAGLKLTELKEIYGVGIFAAARQIKVSGLTIDSLEYALLMAVLEGIEPDKAKRESVIALMRQRREGKAGVTGDDCRRLEAALRLYNELIEAGESVDDKRIKADLMRTERALIRRVKTYSGRIRIEGLEKCPAAISRAVDVLIELSNADFSLPAGADMSKTRYIVLNKKKQAVRNRRFAEAIRELESYKTGDGRSPLFKVVYRMPRGVNSKDVIRLVEPADLTAMRHSEDNLYLPMPYMRASLFIAAEVVLSGGDVKILNPGTRNIIIELYEQLLNRKIEEADLVNIITKPWIILPEIKNIIKDLDKLQTAADALEQAA